MNSMNGTQIAYSHINRPVFFFHNQGLQGGGLNHVVIIFLIIGGIGALSLIITAGIYLTIISREMQLPDIEDLEGTECAVSESK
jgi:hypothetical protein